MSWWEVPCECSRRRDLASNLSRRPTSARAGMERSESEKTIMNTRRATTNRGLAEFLWPLLGVLLCAAFLTHPSVAQPGNSRAEAPAASSPGPDGSGTVDEKEAVKNEIKVAPGTILPVRLNSSLSSSKSKANEVISARIMQDVPLAGGAKIPEGSQVLGYVVEVDAGKGGSPARISLRFDKLRTARQTIPITTNLRAIAGFMEILSAQTPPIGAGESDVYRWLDTVQVGGDVVYGDGGIVTKGDDGSHVVGKSVGGGGVLGQVSAKEGTKCRGPLYGNNSPQALWVFSSDACGTYGLAHLEISHAGRSEPVGLIVFGSDAKELAIHSGTGMLLRVGVQ